MSDLPVPSFEERKEILRFQHFEPTLKGFWICINGHITSTDPYVTPVLCLDCKTRLVKLVFQD